MGGLNSTYIKSCLVISFISALEGLVITTTVKDHPCKSNIQHIHDFTDGLKE